MKTLYHNGKIISRGEVFEGMLLVNNGVIEDILPSPFNIPPADKQVDLKGAYLAPAFIDTHIHGTAGFGTDSGKAEDLLSMSDVLAKQGVAAFTPTLYPAKAAEMAALLKKFSAVVGQEGGAKILGFHLEGPFISPKKPGVMKPSDIQAINLDSAQKIYEAASGKIAAMTTAPELEHIEDLVAFAKERKILLQSGHTDASYEQMEHGADLGITHATHLFNAMRSFNHRDPGAAGAILMDSRFSTEVIADGLHVSPVVVGMVLKLKEADKIVVVTDSLNPTGKQEGLANNEAVYLDNGIFKRKEDNVIAGSALTMLGGLQNLVKWGYPLGKASMATSDNPAALHGLDFGSIQKGKKAKLVILDADLNLKEVVLN